MGGYMPPNPLYILEKVLVLINSGHSVHQISSLTGHHTSTITHIGLSTVHMFQSPLVAVLQSFPLLIHCKK